MIFENLGNLPVLWFSSGLESTLLLVLLAEAGIQFDILQQGREDWMPIQKKRADKLIKEWNLKVFNYPPSTVSLVSDGKEITSVWEYAVTGGKIPILRDVVEGDKCIGDITKFRLHQQPLPWDTHIVGSRFDDKHYAWGDSPIPAKRWKVGEVDFYAPLAEWTREEVIAKSLEYGLDVDKEADEGDLMVCHNCIKGEGEVYCPKVKHNIDSVVWDGKVNLKAFRKAYGKSIHN